MEVIQRQLRQLTRLIDDLLDVSRITRGKVRCARSFWMPRTLLQRAVEAVRGLFDERRHELTLAVRAGALPLQGDPTRLEQIFVNLLTNAARYTDPGGQITVNAARDNGHVVVRVQDNGIGIPPEKLPQVFELFAQGDRALARSEGGLGVGLTIVRSLAELHGGTVHARSEGVGRGSEFIVRLPAVSAPTAVETTAGHTRRPRKPLPRRRGWAGCWWWMTTRTRRTARRGFSSARGTRCGSPTTARCAVEAAREFRPRFVLLDIGLPGMDGYEVARRLRGGRGAAGDKAGGVSGYGQEGDRRRSREAGFDHHLVKPVDPDKLLAWLRESGRSGKLRGCRTNPTTIADGKFIAASAVNFTTRFPAGWTPVRCSMSASVRGVNAC